MSGQRIKIGIQAIVREERKIPRSQEGTQAVDQQVRHVMSARTQLEDGNTLGQRINGHPKPQHLRMAAQARVHLIELYMRDLQATKGALVQGLGMRSGSLEPARDSRMPNPKDPFGGRDIQPFRQRTKYDRHQSRRRFQAIHRGMQPRAEPCLACLTAPPPDLLQLSRATIAHQHMEVRLTDAVVGAGLVRTSHPLGRAVLGCAPTALDFPPGRTGAGFGSRTAAGTEARQRAGQSSGERGRRQRGP